MRIRDGRSDVCSSDLHARPEPPGERTGSGVEDTAPEAVGGLSADRQERLFGALEALEMAQAEHPMDVPRTIDDAGRDVVAAAEITDDRNPLECSVLFVAALPGAEVPPREASVPVEISVFRLDEMLEIGRASCRGRGCTYEWIRVYA